MSQNSAEIVTVLGIDLEGMNKDLIHSGVDTSVDRVIEIGAVLWDWERSQPVKMISELINEVDHLPISDEVEDLTGIDDATLEKWGAKGTQIHDILKHLAELMETANYIMAHNGSGYDYPMLNAMFKRYDMQMPEKVWIDSMTDIEYPRKMHGRSLALLEHSHGFVNPFPHRAVTDVLSMLRVASQYSLTRMGKMAKSPMVTITAALKAPNWKDPAAVKEFNEIKNKVAKSRFRWNPSDKEWTKEVHKILIDEGKIKFDFEYFIKE